MSNLRSGAVHLTKPSLGKYVIPSYDLDFGIERLRKMASYGLFDDDVVFECDWNSSLTEFLFDRCNVDVVEQALAEGIIDLSGYTIDDVAKLFERWADADRTPKLVGILTTHLGFNSSDLVERLCGASACFCLRATRDIGLLPHVLRASQKSFAKILEENPEDSYLREDPDYRSFIQTCGEIIRGDMTDAFKRDDTLVETICREFPGFMRVLEMEEDYERRRTCAVIEEESIPCSTG